MLLEFIALFVLVVLIYKIFSPYDYWKKKGYPYVEGSFPFGTSPPLFFSKIYQGHIIEKIYNELSPHPFGGFYIVQTPHLMLRDPVLIKHIMVKDFSHFRSRFGNRSSPDDPLSQHLFNLEGDLWRSVRVKLTPTFTSGKMKMMYALFEACANNLSKVLDDSVGKDVDIKDLFARFTTDVIVTCAFGLEVDSLNDPTNEFRTIGQDIFPPYATRLMKLTLFIRFSSMRFLRRLLRLTTLPKKVNNFIINTIKDTIDYREKNNVKRNDFLNLLIEMRNKPLSGADGHKKDELEMDMGMIAAQCFVFFAAGFETSSSVQSYALYELAMNQDIQKTLKEEIDEVLAKHGGKPTYEALQEMPYLEQVINEVMRKYPTVPMLTRECTEDFELEEFGLKIKKGEQVLIPTYALHHDPKYFPSPQKFNPSRFSEENKSSIVPFTYLPFGEGPRICIGMRFGMMQTKVGLVTALSRFNIFPSSSTPKTLKFAPTASITIVEGSINLKFEKRQ
ncbi:cytochrome P450 6a2-like [Cimex lectularius]|uniref:Cytochrome P450 n=1 Tax=Cimex lectularius TaxID=79782 RepID=A0A8I6RG14_CIMLE|nr:cytochrome P450 6a2-like [Cimex lectularius]